MMTKNDVSSQLSTWHAKSKSDEKAVMFPYQRNFKFLILFYLFEMFSNLECCQPENKK